MKMNIKIGKVIEYLTVTVFVGLSAYVYVGFFFPDPYIANRSIPREPLTKQREQPKGPFKFEDLLSVPDLLNMDFPPIEYMIRPFWPKAGLGIISGPAGGFKTWLAGFLGVKLAIGSLTDLFIPITTMFTAIVGASFGVNGLNASKGK